MGTLTGLTVIEMAVLAPGAYCGMLLADMGADVLRIDRPEEDADLQVQSNILLRGRRSIALNLKDSAAADVVLRLLETADVLIEGFRPGVMERLGLSPRSCWERNPRLVYARMTGWGQDGPLAHEPGHDINYLALSGVLHAIGRQGQAPVPPLNVAGDMGGGGALLAVGILAALYEAKRSGRGQIVDMSIVEGASSLLGSVWSRLASGSWSEERGTNLFDTGAPFYEVYETADGKYISVGAIEPKFYRNLLRVMGLDGDELPDQNDRMRWPEMKARFAAVFKTGTRAKWSERFAGAEACAAPVLGLRETTSHPHNRARGTFVSPGGVLQPAPTPRFSRTPSAIQRPPPLAGQDTCECLRQGGFETHEIAELLRSSVVRQR